MNSKRSKPAASDRIEIGMMGDLTEHESELTDKLLSVPFGGECTLYIDSPGGSPYCAMSLATIILLRKIRATAFVTGECSSATLWPFAACINRYVTPYSVMLFHPMKWQSEEHVGLYEAAEWARHFGRLEQDMDLLLCNLFQKSKSQVSKWIKDGRYVSGPELVDAGLAKMIQLNSLSNSSSTSTARERDFSVAKIPLLAKTPVISKVSSPSKLTAVAKAPPLNKPMKTSKSKSKSRRRG